MKQFLVTTVNFGDHQKLCVSVFLLSTALNMADLINVNNWCLYINDGCKDLFPKTYLLKTITNEATIQ